MLKELKKNREGKPGGIIYESPRGSHGWISTRILGGIPWRVLGGLERIAGEISRGSLEDYLKKSLE